MADSKSPAVSFDDIIKAGRKKKENERLAQEIFGKRRSSTPGNAKKAGLGGSLASRVGVTKRPSSLSRSQSSQARIPQARAERDVPMRQVQQQPQANRGPRNNGRATLANVAQEANGGSGMSIKGAASGPYIVVASNFAPGTTAADIESVMVSVGGEVTYCKLVASSPTVIVEMGFKEKSGADNVIRTFNNKKADGRLLYVHMRDGSVPTPAPNNNNNTTTINNNTPIEPEPQDAEMYNGDDAMEMDENARAREAENKRREEHRGGSRDNRPRPDAFPSGPRNARPFAQEDDYYYRSAQVPTGTSSFQDGRYGFGGGGYGRGGRYYDDRRGYGRGGPQWRN